MGLSRAEKRFLMNRLVQTLILLSIAIAIVATNTGLAQKQEDTCAGTIYGPKEVTRPAKIKKLTEPSYTEEARAKRVQGTVVLTAVFCRDGKVTNIEVVQGLPYGLTENAIETTRRIEFDPAEKDGEAVSQRFRRECTFSLF
jgi:TonB family protein